MTLLYTLSIIGKGMGRNSVIFSVFTKEIRVHTLIHKIDSGCVDVSAFMTKYY